VAPNASLLIAVRAVRGLGAAVVLALSLTILTGAERDRVSPPNWTSSKGSPMKKIAPLLAALVFAATVTAAGSGMSSAANSAQPLPTSTPAASGTYSGAVTWALYRETNSLDPIFAFDYPENTVISALCDTLLRQSPTGVVGAGLSSLSYTNPTTLVFTIRKGVTFWDGKALTSADVVYSLDRQRNPKLAGFYGLVFDRVKSITATGPLKVTIKLKQPDSWLVGELASTPGFIIEKKFATKAGKNYGSPTGGAMCSGPFKLKAWKTGDKLAVVPNTGYWDRTLRPKVSEIDFKGVPTDAAATSGLETGEIMGDYPLNISTLDQLKKNPKLNVYLGPSYASDAFIVSNSKGALGNVLVRRALSLAIDRKGFINAVYKGAAQLPRALTNPGTWGYGRAVFSKAWNELPVPTTNVDEAKKLIEQAGAKGKTITVGMSSQLTNINTEAVMFQSAGQSIGLKVNLKSVSAANYINFFTDPKARAGIDGFFTVNYPDYADPAALYQTLVMPGGSQNYDNFSDPAITKLMNKARTQADPTKRAELMAQAQKLIAQQVPWIPVAAPDTILIMNKKLTGPPPTFSYMFAPWLAQLGAS
jgi:peptide/nickel transport system substrate-binding protein